MNRLRRQKGFTLLELVMVSGVAMMLMVMGLMTTKHVRNRAMLAVFQTDIRIVKEAAIRFEQDVGFFPPDVWRGIDPGLVNKDGWQEGGHSATWEEMDLSRWNGPYLKKWKLNPWGGLYDWDNYPSHYTCWGIPGGGVYLTLKPSTWGGMDGMPKASFEDLLEHLEIDKSQESGVVAVWMGREPTWSVPGQPQ